MECGARYVDRRLSAGGLSGQRGTCGKQFNELQRPVCSTVRDHRRAMSSHSLVHSGGCSTKLSLRDLAEMFLTRGFIFGFLLDLVRDWEANCFSADAYREPASATQKGKIGPSWYVDETYIRVRGRWRYLYRAIATALWLTSC